MRAAHSRIFSGYPILPHATWAEGKTAADKPSEVPSSRQRRSHTFAYSSRRRTGNLGPASGIIDFERGTKCSAGVFTVLSAHGAKLARGADQLHARAHYAEHGYTEVEPPFMVELGVRSRHRQPAEVRADLFKMAGDWDLYLDSDR
jgi:seryl-tRNA synthetase